MKFKFNLQKEQSGCSTNDVIWVPLSPSDVEDIEIVYRNEAMKAENYIGQGMRREIKDLFEEAHAQWRAEREKLKGISS